jgi:two-component system LytT family sensor kinase
VPAALGGHEWLALLMGTFAGWAGAVCRRAAPNQEEIWAFSPFIDLEVWRWLRNRLDRPFRDWQALMFAVIVTLHLIQFELARIFPNQLYSLDPKTFWQTVSVMAMGVLAVAIPIKIWNNTRIEMKLEEQRRLLLQARLDALTSQINPHFLFNTLNSVASLVRVDPDTARQLIVKLSSILRRLLSKHESYSPLVDELQLIDDYLGIEVVRFGKDKLRVRKEIDPAVLDTLVPSMLLQPIVENSIRHGLSPKISGGNIEVRAFRESGQVVIEIEDDGVGIAPDRMASVRRQGIGISNVQERLRVLYGDSARLMISSAFGQGTRIRIELPDLTLATAGYTPDQAVTTK